MQHVTIWGRADSANVQKVLWACDEMNIVFERIDAGGTHGRTTDPAYRQMNPTMRVPTLVIGNEAVWESNTILRYLASTYSDERLYPHDFMQRSQIERWMDWQLGSLNHPMRVVFLGMIRHVENAAFARSVEDAQQLWSLLDAELHDRRFIPGDTLSLADIAIGPLVHRWFNMPIKREQTPHVEAWYQGLQESAGYRRHVCKPLS